MARRQAREAALRTLFQMDVGKIEQDSALTNVLEEFPLAEEDGLFTRDIVTGATEHRNEIDDIIRKVAVDWHLERMAGVDRSILRLALYEILFRQDVPNAVAVNEAVELAKLYSTDDSGKFVNGILGKVVTQPDIVKQS